MDGPADESRHAREEQEDDIRDRISQVALRREEAQRLLQGGEPRI